MFALARQCGKMPLCALYNPDRLHRHITTGIQHCFQEVFVCVCRGCGHRLSTAMLNQIQKWGICWQKKEQWTMTTYWAGLWLPWLPFPVEECYWAADLDIKVVVPCMDLVSHGSGGRHNCWWLHMWPGTCVTTRWPRMLHPFCSASSMKVYSCGSAMASSSNILYRSKKKKMFYCTTAWSSTIRVWIPLKQMALLAITIFTRAVSCSAVRSLLLPPIDGHLSVLQKWNDHYWLVLTYHPESTDNWCQHVTA